MSVDRNVTVRTRYAPSPTGDPHIGNIRAALFSWAYARANGGQFLLRIEDTDRARLQETSLQAIMDSLHWLGIDWDEGPVVGGPHEPYFQSQRLPLYQHAASRLIDEGNAYRCFCTAERLDQMRKAQQAAKKPPGYDGLCRGIAREESDRRAKAEPFTVRFKMKRDGQTVLNDLIRGDVTFDNALQDDFVAVKSDGYPTYHLAVVVDDTEMQISHAIRGDEWISSAPKHIQLYEALGYTPPVWAHLPLILGPDHKKLSKRSGDTAVMDYAANGYLPEAMVNFLAFLGWSLDDHTSLVTIEDLKQHFDLARVVANPAVFDSERLNYLNGHYIREMDEGRWQQLMVEWSGHAMDDELTAAVSPILRERVTRLDEIGPMTAFLFGDDAPEYPAALLSEKLGGDAPVARATLEAASTALGAIDAASWDKEAVEAAIRSLESSLGLKLRKFVSVLYVAVEGSPRGLPLFDSIAIIGRSRALHRLARALQKLS